MYCFSPVNLLFLRYEFHMRKSKLILCCLSGNAPSHSTSIQEMRYFLCMFYHGLQSLFPLFLLQRRFNTGFLQPHIIVRCLNANKISIFKKQNNRLCLVASCKPPATLEEMNALFLRAQKVAKENAFYFWHYTRLAQMSERISGS